ncbi:EamA family transporter [Paenibacillus sp. 598K]|uniref:EamA family transporter n=1 Tax=Paenibacillus sp. 598K TaxID=1117987 RepID=UPI000FFE6F99|nr:EamA family transporter [Paenibacillus sp. 598K]
MWMLIAIGSAAIFGLAGLAMKISQMRGGSNATLLLALYVSGAAGFALHGAVEGTLNALLTDWRIWAAGAVVGAGSAWGNAVFMKALAYGPASLTSPLVNMNIVLVIAMGIWLYDEPFSGSEATGVGLLLLAIILIAIRRQEPITIREKTWGLYVAAGILLFSLRNGGLKVTEELQLEATPILLAAYALSALWFLPPLLRSGDRASRRIGWRWGLLAGLFSYGGLQLYAMALETGKANLAAPIFATNGLVIALGAILIYRERLTPLQSAAFVCMMAGLVVIRL